MTQVGRFLLIYSGKFELPKSGDDPPPSMISGWCVEITQTHVSVAMSLAGDEDPAYIIIPWRDVGWILSHSEKDALRLIEGDKAPEQWVLDIVGGKNDG